MIKHPSQIVRYQLGIDSLFHIIFGFIVIKMKILLLNIILLTNKIKS